MSKPSPLQKLKAQFGSKKELAAKLAEILEAKEGESKDDFIARLAQVANSKLLHLQALAEKVKTHGGRDGLVQAIGKLENKLKDADYLTSLRSKRSLGWLVDRLESLQRRAKKAA